jgi:hypothetical protein
LSKVELIERVRRHRREETMSIRGLSRRHWVHWRTVRQALQPPRNQRHTARGIWQRLVHERVATVAEPTVHAYVARVRRQLEPGWRTVKVPQLHPPGAEAEVDFGQVSV